MQIVLTKAHEGSLFQQLHLLMVLSKNGAILRGQMVSAPGVVTVVHLAQRRVKTSHHSPSESVKDPSEFPSQRVLL